jgi:hypothetical protein
LEEAKKKEGAAEEGAQKTRADLSAARQNAELLERSHARFRKESEASLLASEEEEAHDVHLARARKDRAP